MKRIAITPLLALMTCALVSPAFAVPTISIDLNPMMPDHIENPDGMLTASCVVDTDGTVPELLRISIMDQSRGVIAQWSYPQISEWTLEWQIPQDLPDGIYTYKVEYYSADGFLASGDANFLVAGSTAGICAFKFIDVNGNGVPDDGEEYAEGWEICFAGPSGEFCEFTDSDGAACIFFLEPGIYEVCETMQEGFESTTGVCTEVLVSDDIEKALFGNREATTPVEDSTWGKVKSIYR